MTLKKSKRAGAKREPCEELRTFALSFPDAYEEFPWGHCAIKVNKKIFVTLGGEDGALSMSRPGATMRTRSNNTPRWIPAFLIPLGAVSAVALVSIAAAPKAPREIIAFEEAELFFEQNATDGDLGLHFKVDGEDSSRLGLVGPNNRVLVDVKVKGNLGQVIGLTELFSESAEPSFDDLPADEFMALFEPGEYRFFGRTLGGDTAEGVATLTHDMPGEAVLIAPLEDEEVDPTEDLELMWELVDDPAPPESVIECYEVVVEKDMDDERLRVFSIFMLPTDTSVRVPAEFFEAGKDYKVEILAQETSGNRTAIEVPFTTE
ncbi:MAG: MmcQ/YjbR family DNA-binding protein [Planctomycetota bacterium]|nr:MAG: MmcQ/YjbR family DNA-binding protein [Planctomycetota bacterium]